MRENIEIKTSKIELSMNTRGHGIDRLDQARVRPCRDSINSRPAGLRAAHEQRVLNNHSGDGNSKSVSLVKGRSDVSKSNLDLLANQIYTTILEEFPGREKASQIASFSHKDGITANLEKFENIKRANYVSETGKISLNGIETSVNELHNLAKVAGDYDPKTGPRENSMVITQDGSKFKALSISAGGDSHGNKNFLSGALLQMYVAKFPWYMTKGKSHGVGLEAHTHQTNIPKTDPYVFSYPDILNGQGKNWPQIISTSDGCILYKQAGSKVQIPEGCFDPNGGFHKTLKNPDGTYSTELKSSSVDSVKCLAK